MNTTHAFLFAPLVYVDGKPQDPSKEYQPRGMALITITAENSIPVATRHGDLVIPGTECAYRGFATVLGVSSTDSKSTMASDPDVYLVAMTSGGLQMARVGLADITEYEKYTFFNKTNLSFTNTHLSLSIVNYRQIYLPGTFSSGSIFFSKHFFLIGNALNLTTTGPYFSTFIMIYFNKLADSTFYIRYLDLENPLSSDIIWTNGGRNGAGIRCSDAEALVKYAWSPEQILYISPTGKGGYNYAGNPHPEYFNRQYLSSRLYTNDMRGGEGMNEWFGSGLVSESKSSSDGQYLLLSWVSQLQEVPDSGVYQIQLAMVEFDSLPIQIGANSTPSTSGLPSQTPSATQGSNPQKTRQNMMHNDGQTIISSLRHKSQLWALCWVVRGIALIS